MSETPDIILPSAKVVANETPENGVKTPLTARQPIITTIDTVPGYRIAEHFGLVTGSIVRSKDLGTDILASMKNIIGGELTGYTKLLEESRHIAIERMLAQAKALGANAVVNVRFATSSVTQGAAELYAYGTAVRLE
jgi:uncharacterized protein YbjQ (UPF0145 family)